MTHASWLAALVLTGLYPADPRPAIGEATGGWSRADLVGCRLDLIDDQQIRQYSFHEKGYVVATIGRKGGLVCGPVFYWHLNQDGFLVITENEDGNGPVKDRLTKVKLHSDRAEVERGGRREAYKRTKY